MTETETIDFDARYTVKGYRGVAWGLTGWAREWEPVMLLCIDDETGEEWWEPDPNGDGEWVENRERVTAAMVGDDTEYEFGIDEITRIPDDGYCPGCG